MTLVKNSNGTITKFRTPQAAHTYAVAIKGTLQHTSGFGLALLIALNTGKGTSR